MYHQINTFKSPPSPIQTLTVGPGISPGQSSLGGVAGYTAGREFHPAPKDSHFYLYSTVYDIITY